ncbi:hypothetical protein BGZ79_009471 [Entomortierella chlamydospora]|nr:hypothetical protein BGZ79_009471 [Entomortierella chlamydospora]
MVEKKRKLIEEKAQPAVRLSRSQLYKERLPLATIGAFESFLSWVLMLIVMTFNASLLFSAVAGSFIGFLFFGRNGLDDDCGCGDISQTEDISQAEDITQAEDDVPSGNSSMPYPVARSILPRIVGVAFLVILFLWIYQAEGGIGFQEATVFGWHALFMSLFVVVFTQEALLAYSSPLIGFFTKNRTMIK